MSNKDWTGNKTSVFVCNGDKGHTDVDRPELDYYATPPEMAEALLKMEPDLDMIWEPACGEGHLAEVFVKANKLARASDIVDRGYGYILDFLKENATWAGDIVTNPPYNKAQEFVEHALNVIQDGRKVCMFLKLTFLEGQKRRKLFNLNCLKNVYVSAARVNCALNGEFHNKQSSAVAYAWFVWEKGYNGKPMIDWFN
jgi:hypothetical protein